MIPDVIILSSAHTDNNVPICEELTFGAHLCYTHWILRVWLMWQTPKHRTDSQRDRKHGSWSETRVLVIMEKKHSCVQNSAFKLFICNWREKTVITFSSVCSETTNCKLNLLGHLIKNILQQKHHFTLSEMIWKIMTSAREGLLCICVC